MIESSVTGAASKSRAGLVGGRPLVSGPQRDLVQRVATFVVEVPSRIARAVLRPYAKFRRIGASAPTELIIAPQDIRTADPTHAEDIYAGFYVFGGRMVNAEGRSPFDIPPPSAEWARELVGFAWLRHMRAADTALARANARAMVGDFLVAYPRLRGGVAGEPAVAARRILSWLSQSPFILNGADADFYRAFMKGLGRDAAVLTAAYRDLVGADRFTASIALAELALCSHAPLPALRRASTLVAEEATSQIFSDGGHVGRDPETLVDLLLDLLPLRQTYVARQQPTPQAILNAIDRMIPMVRLLRHGEGSLSLFNGMGLTEPDHLATVLAYDDARGRALLNAPHSGYQRLEGGGNAIVIADVGRSPPARLSADAHAGCLSFEFSMGHDRFVVNCGAPLPGKPAAREASRQTAAHSTLVLDDTSSCRFVAGRSADPGRTLIAAGPQNVSVSRRELPEATVLDASHDGYVRHFGLVHERRIALTRDGARILGQDRLLVSGRGDRAAQRFALRFHIHPDIAIEPASDGRSVRLASRRGATVVFEAGDAETSVEESVFFAAPSGMLRTSQIVVSGPATPETEIGWSFTRQ
jgi:uncharacterized heparinase superfamily protein